MAIFVSCKAIVEVKTIDSGKKWKNKKIAKGKKTFVYQLNVWWFFPQNRLLPPSASSTLYILMGGNNIMNEFNGRLNNKTKNINNNESFKTR